MTEAVMQWEDTLSRRLISDTVISTEQAAQAREWSKRQGTTLDDALLKLGIVEDSVLLPCLAATLRLPYHSELVGIDIDDVALKELSSAYCQSNSIAPIIRPNGSRRIMLSAPAREDLITELAFFLGQPPLLCVAPRRIIRALLNDGGVETAQRIEAPEVSTEIRQESDGPVIRFVTNLLEDAVAQGASDLHFEAQEEGLRIRLRQNGILYPYPVDKGLGAAPIFARIKVMASMNVSERRLPQDGRITATISGRKVDFRVSSVPTSFGESIVCRVLDPQAVRLGWNRLGFEESLSQAIRDIVEQPSGLFLVTGPTGSGKTTTLYTALSHLNSEGRKILTVEDPVEYNLPGVEQVQIHDEIGMSFARALRAFLRQDPNIIMVGEIRDQETAEIACRAALVGRMVLSTLHTNSPEGAVTRLKDLGVPTYIIRDVLRGALGQRLDIVSEMERKLSARLVHGEALSRCFDGA